MSYGGLLSFTVVNVEQRSPEWFQARCGRLTGSRAADMLSTIKSGESAARRDLRMQLVCERLTHQPQEDGYVNAAMQRGIDMEAAAFSAYEAVTGQMAQRTGFLSHESLMCGCSLDGHLGNFDGVVSLKCPKSATHLGYLRAGVMPPSYVPQMLHELWITGAKFYDFLSFDDRFVPALQVFYVRVERDEKAIDDYERKVIGFLETVDRECEAVATMADLPGTLAAALG